MPSVNAPASTVTAGMACAYYLAEKGYPVTVFDRNPVPSGMLMLGIPSFRLEKEVVNAEIEILSEMGVKFQCGVEVGKDVTIAQLREQGYCGFYVAIGAQKSGRSAVRAKRSRACLAAWISCVASSRRAAGCRQSRCRHRRRQCLHQCRPRGAASRRRKGLPCLPPRRERAEGGPRGDRGCARRGHGA